MTQQAQSSLDAGVEHYRNGEFEQAVECLKLGLDVDKSNWKMRFYLAMSYSQLQKNREAKQEFITIRDFCPDPEMRKRATSALAAISAS